MNDSIVKRTQDSLGKIIGKKPPLTEKLLNRPPFRFLHDIITSVIRQTGFMKGLFTDKESSAESITTKEDKVAFLQKAIDITVYVTGAKLSVRPSKVVAGLEAEKTNDFLQALAEAIEKKPDNEACVKKILGGGGGEPSSRTRDSNTKESGESKDKDRERSADRRKRRSDRNEDKENRQSTDKREGSGRNREERKDREREDRKERDKEERKEKDKEERKEKEKDDRKHRDSSKDGRRESSRHRESSRDRKETDRRDDRRERSGRGHRKREEEQVNDQAEESTNAKSAPAAEDPEGEDEPTANRIPRPSSAKGSRRRHREGRRPQPDMEDDENAQPERNSMQRSGGQEEDSVVPPQVEQTRRLARPSSARPAPPRVKRQEGMQDSLNERVDSARTQRVQNVIIDDAQHSEEEEDANFVVEEGVQDPLVPEREETIAPLTEDDGQHGGLVKKILESKKEYAQSEQPQPSQTKTKIDKSSMNDATRHKEKEMVKKEVDKLRGSIQTLTRSANPLGKVMDYVQEDLHSMQKERDMWKAENRKLMEQIRQEMSVTDGSIEPLKVTLAQLEQAVADQLDLIAAVKHSIIDSDEKITKMISSVSRT